MLRITLVCLLFTATAVADEATIPFQEPQGPLTLEQALHAALTNAPALATYPWDLRIADARIVQAGLRPNPEFAVELENVRLGDSDGDRATSRTLGTGPEGPIAIFEREREADADPFSDAELTLSLSQTMELGGKRAARIAAAEKERDVASWDFEVARADVAGDVIVRFTSLLAAQARLRQQDALVSLAETFAASVGGLVDAGSVSPLEGKRAEAEAERTRVQRQELMRVVEQARNHLAALWGSGQAAFTEAVGDVTVTPPLPALATLIEARASHPMLKRWGAELARRDALVVLERKQRTPDLTLSLGYRGTSLDATSARSLSVGSEGISGSRTSVDGDDWENSVVLEASIPLPLFHRNQGAIAEAELMVGRLGDEQRAWEQSLEAALGEQHGAASAALEKLESLSARVLPELESTLALTREGYERGKFDFLRVIDAQRAVFDVRSEILDAQVDYHLARAAMEQLTGAAIIAADTSLTGSLPEAQKENRHE